MGKQKGAGDGSHPFQGARPTAQGSAVRKSKPGRSLGAGSADAELQQLLKGALSGMVQDDFGKQLQKQLKPIVQRLSTLEQQRAECGKDELENEEDEDEMEGGS